MRFNVLLADSTSPSQEAVDIFKEKNMRLVTVQEIKRFSRTIDLIILRAEKNILLLLEVVKERSAVPVLVVGVPDSRSRSQVLESGADGCVGEESYRVLAAYAVALLGRANESKHTVYSRG